MDKRTVISYRIKGVNQWFHMKYDENGKRDFSILLKTSIIRQAAKSLSNSIPEQTLMGIYNTYYGGSVPLCGFCENNLSCMDFDLNINDDGYVEFTPIETHIYKCNDKCCRHNRSKLNPNSIEYVSKSQRVDYDTALKIIHERNKTPFYFHPEIQTEEEYRKSQVRDMNWFIKTYGEDNAQERINHRKEMLSKHLSRIGLTELYGEDEANRICQSRAITLDTMIKKYGEEDGLNRYNHWIDTCKQTKTNFINRHGEEIGSIMWDEYIDKVRYNSSKERLVDQYGQEKADEIAKVRYGITIEKMIEKYGEYDGARRYNNWVRGISFNGQTSSRGNIQSKSAKQFFIKLYNILLKNGFNEDDMFFAYENKREYFISIAHDGVLKNRVYFLDFYIKSLKFNIEYNGTYWHPRNDFTEEEILQWNKRHIDNQYHEAIKKENQRISDMNDIGVQVVVIWDSDDEEERLKECVNIICELRDKNEKTK